MSNYSNKSNYSDNYYYINKSNCNTIWEKSSLKSGHYYTECTM